MQQTTDTDFPYFFGRESLLLGNDHGNGCYIHAVFEGVFVTGFECGDINCDGYFGSYRAVVIDPLGIFHIQTDTSVGCRLSQTVIRIVCQPARVL